MKRISPLIIIITILFFSCRNSKEPVLSELDRQDITVLIRNYTDALKRSDWPMVVAMNQPEVFNIVPKQELEKTMDKSFNGENFKTHVTTISIDTIYPVIEKGYSKYSLVKMKVASSMVFSDTLDKNYSVAALE